MDGPGEHYAKWHKPVGVPQFHSHVEFNEQTELTNKLESDS